MGILRSSPRSAGSAGSLLSFGSSGSILSIGSTGSILSIGSAGSILSIGSVASVGSVFSICSAASVGSVLSALSSLSVLAWRSAGKGTAAPLGQWRLPWARWSRHPRHRAIEGGEQVNPSRTALAESTDRHVSGSYSGNLGGSAPSARRRHAWLSRSASAAAGLPFPPLAVNFLTSPCKARVGSPEHAAREISCAESRRNRRRRPAWEAGLPFSAIAVCSKYSAYCTIRSAHARAEQLGRWSACCGRPLRCVS